MRRKTSCKSAGN